MEKNTLNKKLETKLKLIGQIKLATLTEPTDFKEELERIYESTHNLIKKEEERPAMFYKIKKSYRKAKDLIRESNKCSESKLIKLANEITDYIAQKYYELQDPEEELTAQDLEIIEKMEKLEWESLKYEKKHSTIHPNYCQAMHYYDLFMRD